ncbi:hypothetical protein DVH05_005204 [Phytophthora capsici]|nr:hypothetical protein DVH05_005204 [Phytophthora capsici]
MRVSQVLAITAATLLFASDTVAVGTSNQAKILKMEQSSPSQRLLRSIQYPVEEEEEDSVDFEERGFATPGEEDLEERSPLSDATVNKLKDIAKGWGTSYKKVVTGRSNVSEEKIRALIALRDAYNSGVTRNIEKANMLILRANKS